MVEKPREKRQTVDPVFKQILQEEFAAYQAICQTEYEVSRLPRTIDAVVTVHSEAERQKIRAETSFFYLAKDNQLEFKGRRDRLTKDGYTKIRGRMEFLLSEKGISPLTTTVTIISAGKPREVFAYAKDERKQPFVATDETGYYKTDEQPPIYLIVINELPIVEKNYPLLIFASSQQKFRKFLEQMITEGERTYIRYAYEVRPQVTKEVLTMAGISTMLSKEDLEFMAGDIGRDLVAVMDLQDVFSGMDPERRRRFASLLSPEERLANLSPEERLADLSPEELLKGMTPEQYKALANFLAKASSVAATDESVTNGNGKH